MSDETRQPGLPDKQLVLRTDNLVKKYGKRTVVSHVSIHLEQGEIVGLLGPNGAGKTTTFYMTVGLIVPNEGSIYLGDQDITRFPVYKRAQHGIGYLAQEASIFRKMSVEDNIKSVLEFTDKTPDERKKKLEELIAEFGLEKVRKNQGDRLSGVNVEGPKSPAAWRSTPSSSCWTNPLQELIRLPYRISSRL